MVGKIAKNKMGKQGLIIGAVAGVVLGAALLPESIQDKIKGTFDGLLKGGK